METTRTTDANETDETDETTCWRYCGGCGDRITDETTAAWHDGVAYCRGCEDAPSDEE